MSGFATGHPVIGLFPIGPHTSRQNRVLQFSPSIESVYYSSSAHLLTFEHAESSLSVKAFESPMSTSAKRVVETRRCAYCGKQIAVHLTQCPYCREAVPQVQLSRRMGPNGRVQMRRGLLYMLLAAIIYFFAAGYAAPLWLPVQVLPVVTNILVPLLFFGGLGLSIYGLILRAKS